MGGVPRSLAGRWGDQMAGAGNPRRNGRGGKLPLGGTSKSERTAAPNKGRPAACLLRCPGHPGPSGRWDGRPDGTPAGRPDGRQGGPPG
ncbi:hypothetical protein NDU88_001075 [Pleurodeles waltl]|uniref:Uncharacterized protein n=1 Tax=Pleurodeles waltl TaxID=8319 RepID=A0AAV7L8F5_PLEWA|nr:hypothetical protein NDU88_001075 [Pleurodeles waltl]